MAIAVDAAGNACPSMHVAIAIFSAIWIDRLLMESRVPIAFRIVNGAWFVAIAWSTLAIKQHVVLDALAGAALGVLFAIVSLRLRPGSRHAAADRVAMPAPSPDTALPSAIIGASEQK